MTEPSPNAATSPSQGGGLIRALVLLAASASILLVLWFLGISQINPYVRATLHLKGSQERGLQLFRMNCAGCHGIAGQGLVGPDLHRISRKKNDSQLIRQVVSGKTPPMPSFELEPQAMADLLSHLHSLS